MSRHAGLFGGYRGQRPALRTPHVKQRMTSYECQDLGETDLRVQADPAALYGLLTGVNLRRGLCARQGRF
jgi:hypothetical protein